jgi:hypothetical protein
MSLTEDTWRLWRDDPEFSQRLPPSLQSCAHAPYSLWRWSHVPIGPPSSRPLRVPTFRSVIVGFLLRPVSGFIAELAPIERGHKHPEARRLRRVRKSRAGSAVGAQAPVNGASQVGQWNGFCLALRLRIQK